MSVGDVIAGALMLTEGALSVTAGLGLHSFYDVFVRFHAVTKPAT